MPHDAQPIAGLDRYLTALEVLASTQQQLDAENLWTYIIEASSPRDALDDVVAALCQQARVAAKLATAAESLCSSLVAERYHLHRGSTTAEATG